MPSRNHRRRTISRRSFVRSIAYAGAALPLINPRLVRAVSPNEKLMHACIGGAGMAAADMQQLAKHANFTLFAVCDVDQRNFATAKSINPDCKTYTDWRQLLDREEKNFDSANVTIPDHMHAPVAMSLIHRGKHVYCQKPLTHDVYESRQLRLAADKAGIASQMGIQVHSALPYRLGVHLIQAGHIGLVREVHTGSSKNWGGGERPAHADPVPAELDWDGWIGAAPARPHVNGIYHQSNWRRWLDFGTGTFGDMGCHIYDPVFKALDVDFPTRITSRGPAPFRETWPTEAEVHYVFPGSQYTEKTVEITWYDGGRMPPASILAILGDVRPPDQGSIFIGRDGAMLMPHVAGPRLFPMDKFKDVRYPKIETPDHWFQFVEASMGRGQTLAPFSYSGKLTEAVLLGGIAVRFPNEPLEWNAAELKFTSHTEANHHIRREYRKGWEVEGLS